MSPDQREIVRAARKWSQLRAEWVRLDEAQVAVWDRLLSVKMPNAERKKNSDYLEARRRAAFAELDVWRAADELQRACNAAKRRSARKAKAKKRREKNETKGAQ